MGRRRERLGSSGAAPKSSDLATGAPTYARGKSSPGFLPPGCPPTRRRSGRPWRGCASAAARQLLGDEHSARPSRTRRTRGQRGRSAGRSLRRPAPAASPGGARFSEKHANFGRNGGDATDRRRPGADGRGAAPHLALRRRARAGGAAPRRGCARPTGGRCRLAVSDPWRRPSRPRRRLPVRGAAAGRADATSSIRIGGDDRRGRRCGGVSAAVRSSAGCGARRIGRCRDCRWTRPRLRQRLSGPALQQARVARRRRPRRSAPT